MSTCCLPPESLYAKWPEKSRTYVRNQWRKALLFNSLTTRQIIRIAKRKDIDPLSFMSGLQFQIVLLSKVAIRELQKAAKTIS